MEKKERHNKEYAARGTGSFISYVLNHTVLSLKEANKSSTQTVIGVGLKERNQSDTLKSCTSQQTTETSVILAFHPLRIYTRFVALSRRARPRVHSERTEPFGPTPGTPGELSANSPLQCSTCPTCCMTPILHWVRNNGSWFM